MNTDNLTKLYHRLTPAERLPLIIAAGLRGDAVEQKRLAESAPKLRLEVPDYYPLAYAHRQAEAIYLHHVLDLSAQFWLWWGLWIAGPARRGKARDRKPARGRAVDDETAREFRGYALTRYHAYRLTVHIDAWKQFCTDRSLDPYATLQYERSWGTVQFAADKARHLAHTYQEACLFLTLENLKDGEALPEVIPGLAETVPGLVKDWHAMLDHLLKKEGG